MVRAFLFDMGNVLIHFSHDRMYRQIGELVGRAADETRSLCERSQWLVRSDLAEVTDAEAAAELGKLFQVPLEPAELWRAAADIFWRNEAIEPLVSHIASLGLPMVLVSNTCSAHVRWVSQRFAVLNHFRYRILSYEVGAAKPSERIFAAAAQAAGCPPADCLFIDDTAGHVEAARQLGFDAIRYETVPQLARDLLQRGIPIRG